jgi:nudix-type nucleoside diphosphatase (YffH/AdpP family)
LLDGDDPAQCAKREAEEELGFRLANLRFMTTVYATPGAVTERLSLFIADYDHAARISAGGGEAHEGEDIEVMEMPFDEMRRMVQDGRIVDAKTVLLSLFLERELGLPPL